MCFTRSRCVLYTIKAFLLNKELKTTMANTSSTMDRPTNKKKSDPSVYNYIYTIVLSCFLVSGISGLIYEVVWTRMLTYVFGGTTLAVSTVLTAFLAVLL